MKRLLSAASFAAALVLAAACSPGENRTAEPAASVAAAPAAAIPYGANKDTGATFVHDGVTLHYETYGVLASDNDLIRLDHIVTIYKSLPNAQLAIFPDSTHLIPYDDPERFNSAVHRFLATPFRKIDLIPETMGSFEKMMGGLPH